MLRHLQINGKNLNWNFQRISLLRLLLFVFFFFLPFSIFFFFLFYYKKKVFEMENVMVLNVNSLYPSNPIKPNAFHWWTGNLSNVSLEFLLNNANHRIILHRMKLHLYKRSRLNNLRFMYILYALIRFCLGIFKLINFL